MKVKIDLKLEDVISSLYVLLSGVMNKYKTLKSQLPHVKNGYNKKVCLLCNAS